MRASMILCTLSLLSACGGDESSSSGMPSDSGTLDASSTAGASNGGGGSSPDGAAPASGGESGSAGAAGGSGEDDSGIPTDLDGGAPPEVDAASQTDSGANSGDGDGGGSVDGDSGVDASTVTSATVEDVQQGSVTGQVTLTNVYVTAIDNVGASRGIWVADALAAAAWQGVFVATGATAPAVSVGETVSVTGTVSEFDLPGGGDTLTQITTTTDQVDGTTVISGNPTPVIVAPEVLADITNGEAYESVLVQIGPAKVTALNSGNRITVTDNGGHSLVVDDDLYAASPAINDCYSSITGVMTVNLADNERRLLPRGAVDLVIGSGCL